MIREVTNIIVAGLGGQGVITASDIVADAAFRVGHDVKKAEIHGMSQRGGSLTSDVRYGPRVLSPMVPPGEADYLLVLDATQVDNNRHALRPGGVLLTLDMIDEKQLSSRKSVNVALVGMLSRYLDIAEDVWLEALLAKLAAKHRESNLQAFQVGRATAKL